MSKTLGELQFFVEPLERRLLLSGNVLASFVGDDLFISGDDQDNDIQFELIDGSLNLVGNDTTINESTNNFLVSDGSSFDGRVVLRLNEGNDQILFSAGTTFNDNVSVSTDAGDDTVGFAEAIFNDAVSITTADGNDSIAANSTNLENVFLVSGDGEDTLSIVDSSIDGILFIRSGSETDNIVIQNTTVNRGTFANSGSGDDRIVVEDSTFAASARFKSRSGDDFIELDANDFQELVKTKAGSGDDTVAWGENNTEGASFVFGSSGDDQTDSASLLGSDGPVAAFGIESDEASADLIDELLNDPESGALTLSGNLQSFLTGVDSDSGTGGDQDDDQPGDNSDGDTTEEQFSLSVDFSPSIVNQVNDVLVINDSLFEFNGTTTPGTVVALAVGDDNIFDDGTVVADDNGEFEFSLRLDGELQQTDIQVRARTAAGEEMIESVSVFLAVERSVVFETSLGAIEIELLAEDAPLTVQNFLSYFERGEELIVHRAPDDFVVQTGGFTFENGQINSVVTDPPIQNEFDPDNSNLRGTVSVALLGGQPNSGTSGFFINVVDNVFLDDALHTVFGRVTEESLAVVDAINELPIFDLRAITSNSAFGETPLRNYEPLSVPLAGTVTTATGSTTVIGDGTAFLSEIPGDNTISIGGVTYQIASITSDTQIELASPAQTDENSTVATVNPEPTDENFVFVRAT